MTESKKPSGSIILSFDFEGFNPQILRYSPLALGYVVLVNGKLTELVRQKAYHKGLEKSFDKDTLLRFWKKFQPILDSLTVPEPPKDDPNKYWREMTIKFVRSVRENMILAKEKNLEFVIIHDNSCYDLVMLQKLLSDFNDDLIKEFPDYAAQFQEWPEDIRPDAPFFYPLPFSFTTPNVYGACRVVDASDVLRGFVDGLEIDLEKKSPNNGVDNALKIMKSVFQIPDDDDLESFKHDHDPVNDSATVAYPYFCYLQIRNGVFKRKSLTTAGESLPVELTTEQQRVSGLLQTELKKKRKHE